MTPNLSNKKIPSIDWVASNRWLKRIIKSSPWFHEEVAKRMKERLDCITLKPKTWWHINALNGGLASHETLLKAFPNAPVFLSEYTPAQLTALQEKLQPHWWGKFIKSNKHQQFGTPSAPVDMIWSNMLLHQCADPMDQLQMWFQKLNVNGFIFFSCLGPDSLRELHSLYAAQNWGEPGEAFVDMHDWGDLLLEAGYVDPVVDMEHITLTYSSGTALLEDLRTLGANFHPQRFSGLRTPRWHDRLMKTIENPTLYERTADGRIKLTLEINYGHAIKLSPNALMSETSVISLENFRDHLKKKKR